MKITEIRELAPVEIEARKRELKHELVHLRIAQTSGQIEKPHRIREVRRTIARLSTVLTQKTSPGATSESPKS